MSKKDYSQMNTSEIVSEIKEIIRFMDELDASYGNWFMYDHDYGKYETGSIGYWKLKQKRCKRVAEWLSHLSRYLNIAIRSTESKANELNAHIDYLKENEKRIESMEGGKP